MENHLKLEDLDYNSLRNVLRKVSSVSFNILVCPFDFQMTAQSGTRIYGSCKSIKKTIDRMKPSWRSGRALKLVCNGEYLKTEGETFRDERYLEAAHSIEFQYIECITIVSLLLVSPIQNSEKV